MGKRSGRNETGSDRQRGVEDVLALHAHTMGLEMGRVLTLACLVAHAIQYTAGVRQGGPG